MVVDANESKSRDELPEFQKRTSRNFSSRGSIAGLAVWKFQREYFQGDNTD